MSQQIIPIVSLAGVDVGDLEYIEGKVLANNYFQVSGDINAINDTIEQIVPSGKRAFLIEAGIRLLSDNAFGATNNIIVRTTNKVTASLKIDGVVKDTVRAGDKAITSRGSGALLSAGAGGVGGDLLTPFNVLGVNLVGDGVKKITIENVSDSGSAFAVMSGYFV